MEQKELLYLLATIKAEAEVVYTCDTYGMIESLRNILRTIDDVYSTLDVNN